MYASGIERLRNASESIGGHPLYSNTAYRNPGPPQRPLINVSENGDPSSEETAPVEESVLESAAVPLWIPPNVR